MPNLRELENLCWWRCLRKIHLMEENQYVLSFYRLLLKTETQDLNLQTTKVPIFLMETYVNYHKVLENHLHLQILAYIQMLHLN